VKAVARRQKPLHNLHSVASLTKQLLTRLLHDLSSGVKCLLHVYVSDFLDISSLLHLCIIFTGSVSVHSGIVTTNQ